MQPFRSVTGAAAPLPAANIDTDVIMPKQFLKGVDRSGLDRGVFYDLRFDAAGGLRPDFVLNQTPWRNAAFLVVGPNFGCGSSREHAVWGLAQLGVRALIGTSFGGIFFDNCARNGLLAVELPPEAHALLLEAASDPARLRMTIDLQSQTIASGGLLTGFEIEPSRRQALLDGLDAVGATLARGGEIRAFEARHLRAAPWLMVPGSEGNRR
ncbi:MAG: 3-isopropylmalate dehydratase small subunit [Phenylobacterium sp. RIFCSPHIGHO2_01_FULL_69_31]|uniref:3-isopropylmalate dehydratase small subunit n=1 Tax=Phenylobacterium sp. RIFCSPHIGHO2_01_FULL_69_31 TaxID=1801944 RepID=UPI0008C92FA8|nr:3-isopropylmalate dehydratase small subunit [Phenylobacterium sp. RIFCSPHIGHO2_01_FULL_69_31]OHB29143.1 MAG: 3-isopropylmalate dehydratase small subunit [Phenylobacterium sp. RIFCSPHIGHO2_01_FULL_69_31]